MESAWILFILYNTKVERKVLKNGINQIQDAQIIVGDWIELRPIEESEIIVNSEVFTNSIVLKNKDLFFASGTHYYIQEVLINNVDLTIETIDLTKESDTIDLTGEDEDPTHEHFSTTPNIYSPSSPTYDHYRNCITPGAMWTLSGN